MCTQAYAHGAHRLGFWQQWVLFIRDKENMFALLAWGASEQWVGGRHGELVCLWSSLCWWLRVLLPQGPSLCVLCSTSKVSCCISRLGLSLFTGVGLGKVYGPGTSTITSIATIQTKNYDLKVCKKTVTWYNFSWFFTKLLLRLCSYRHYWSPIPHSKLHNIHSQTSTLF